MCHRTNHFLISCYGRFLKNNVELFCRYFEKFTALFSKLKMHLSVCLQYSGPFPILSSFRDYCSCWIYLANPLKNQVLNQIVQEMEYFSRNQGISQNTFSYLELHFPSDQIHICSVQPSGHFLWQRIPSPNEHQLFGYILIILNFLYHYSQHMCLTSFLVFYLCIVLNYCRIVFYFRSW